MEVILLAGAVAMSGMFVKAIDMRARKQELATRREGADDDDFDLLPSQQQLVTETIYADDRLHSMRHQESILAEEQFARTVRERSIYTNSENFPQTYQHQNVANRSVIERFSADLPESSAAAGFVWGNKRETAGPATMPTYVEDAVGNLQKFSNRAADTLNNRMDGVKMLDGQMLPDMPLTDTQMLLSGVLMPKVGSELNVKFKQDVANNRGEIASYAEAPPILTELRQPRNPLASMPNYHTGWIERGDLLKFEPNRDTEFVGQQVSRAGRARKRYDEEAMPVRLASAQDAGIAFRAASKGYDGLRPRNGRPDIQGLAIGPAEMTRFDARDPLQKSQQAPDPTKKEEIIMANHLLGRQLNVDANVNDLFADRGQAPRMTLRETMMHQPRMPLADNETRIVGGWPMLQARRIDAPKVGMKEAGIFSNDPDSGLIGPKSNNLWMLGDGRGHTPLQPPQLNLRESMVQDAPRKGMPNRPDLSADRFALQREGIAENFEPDAGGPKGRRVFMERDARKYRNANFGREFVPNGGSAELPNRSVGKNQNIRQFVAWDGHNRARPFSESQALPTRISRNDFVSSGLDSKARKQAVLESGLSWPSSALLN